MSTQNKRRVYLLPLTMPFEPSARAEELAEEYGFTTTESPAEKVKGELVDAFDTAYNNGSLPSELSWGNLLHGDLPEGWIWTRTGAFQSCEVPTDDHKIPYIKVSNGEVTISGTQRVPLQALLAVIARDVGKVDL